MEFDEALKQIGGFGRYQKWIFFLICWTSVPVSFHNMAYVFIAGIPEHHCASLFPENVSCMLACRYNSIVPVFLRLCGIFLP